MPWATTMTAAAAAAALATSAALILNLWRMYQRRRVRSAWKAVRIATAMLCACEREGSRETETEKETERQKESEGSILPHRTRRRTGVRLRHEKAASDNQQRACIAPCQLACCAQCASAPKVVQSGPSVLVKRVVVLQRVSGILHAQLVGKRRATECRAAHHGPHDAHHQQHG